MQVLYFSHMKYKAIGFDHGGVIEGRPGSEFNKMICMTLQVSLDQYEHAYFAHNRDTVNDTPISAEDKWKRVLDDLNKSDQFDQLIHAINNYGLTNNITNNRLLRYITSLKEKGFKTGLLSNNSIEVAQKLRDKGQDNYFDIFIISDEVGLTKPDPAIFDLFTKQLGVEMNELIFVDDSPQSLSTADECGYTPILYTTFDDLVLKLKELGIDIS